MKNLLVVSFVIGFSVLPVALVVLFGLFLTSDVVKTVLGL